jgi:hypothetical protein
MILFRSRSSTVLWTNVFPFVGHLTENPGLKLAPTPKTTSDSLTCVASARDMLGPPAPSDSWCVSGNALFPSMLVPTGASSSSATCLSSAHAFA